MAEPFMSAVLVPDPDVIYRFLYQILRAMPHAQRDHYRTRWVMSQMWWDKIMAMQPEDGAKLWAFEAEEIGRVLLRLPVEIIADGGTPELVAGT